MMVKDIVFIGVEDDDDGEPPAAEAPVMVVISCSRFGFVSSYGLSLVRVTAGVWISLGLGSAQSTTQHIRSSFGAVCSGQT
ncbi:hypothetical protein Hanom_Chr16g01464401 [Helianthus anomalus]